MSNYLFLILAIVAEAAGTKKHRKGGTIPPFHKKKAQIKHKIHIKRWYNTTF